MGRSEKQESRCCLQASGRPAADEDVAHLRNGTQFSLPRDPVEQTALR
jgi:hypothetical protein